MRRIQSAMTVDTPRVAVVVAVAVFTVDTPRVAVVVTVVICGCVYVYVYVWLCVCVYVCMWIVCGCVCVDRVWTVCVVCPGVAASKRRRRRTSRPVHHRIITRITAEMDAAEKASYFVVVPIALTSAWA